jgi:hypothetical protein
LGLSRGGELDGEQEIMPRLIQKTHDIFLSNRIRKIELSNLKNTKTNEITG